MPKLYKVLEDRIKTNKELMYIRTKCLQVQLWILLGGVGVIYLILMYKINAIEKILGLQ